MLGRSLRKERPDAIGDHARGDAAAGPAELLLGGFTFLMAVVGLASLAAVALAGTGAGLRVLGADAGGSAAGGAATLVGEGEAAVAAETATLQLLLGPADPGMIMGGGSTSRGEAGVPGDAERRAAEPIAQAIQTAGVTPADVSVKVSPALENGYYGPATGYGMRIDVTVRQPTTETVNRVVEAAGAAAVEANLRLAQVGVAYAITDCTTIERRAREQAIADARVSAGQQAELLGTALGELILSSDVPEEGTEGVRAYDGCGAPPASASAFPYDAGGGMTLPRFELSQPAEATARVRVSLTYELAEE